MGNLSLLFIIPILLFSCKKEEDPAPNIFYKDEMRKFVKEISAYAKAQKSSFAVIPQNGQEIMTTDGEPDSPVDTAYIKAIDGIGREDLFYGYDNDNAPTPAEDRTYMLQWCDIAKANNIKVLVTDYCSAQNKMADSYQKNAIKGYISFAADHRELDNIPSYPATIQNENSNIISSLAQAKNFLYLINAQNYLSKQELIAAVNSTNYDLVIMDLFFNTTAFTLQEITSLKTKANGGKRLIISYMSIGEAEDYRYYWQSNWNSSPPTFLDKVNPDWPGNYKVKYWMPEWKQVITGNTSSYIQKILDSGFDGVYLDIIDAWEYFN